MKLILASLFASSLVNPAMAAPVLTEPRAYVAGSSYEVGRGLWSYGDAAYAAQSGSVVRYQRTNDAVVKTDSVYSGSMTETPMYIAKDSLHGFIVGNNGVCMVDWSVHPGKLGQCVDLKPFGHGGFTGGLALGRYLDVCNGRSAYAIDTWGDSLHLVDSLSRSQGGLRCQIEGEVLHTVGPASSRMMVRSQWMANNLSRIQSVDVDSASVGTFFWVAGQGAGLLALDSNGILDRLMWGTPNRGPVIAGIAHLAGRYKTASQSGSNIVFTSDSTIYLVDWANGGVPFLAAQLSFGAALYGEPMVAVDGPYVWVRTPTGLLSLVVKDQTSGIGSIESSRIGSWSTRVALHGDRLDIEPSKSGIVQILTPNGRVLENLGVQAGVPTTWKPTRGGLLLVRMSDRTVSVIVP